MLTLFTVPKGFEGHIGVIQRNAIRSWKALGPDCKAILFGDDAGVSEAAEEFGVQHVASVTTTEYGTPLLNDVFAIAEKMSSHKLLAYVNADLLLPPTFLRAVSQVANRHARFLMVGRTWNVDLAEDIDGDLDVADLVARTGLPRASWAIDYFVFPAEAIGPLPPFAVGRPGWDNWMIYNARRRRMPVVDASRYAPIGHQRHGYEHVPNGTGEASNGPEGERNRALMRRTRLGFDVPTRMFTLDDATEVLTPSGIFPAEAHRGLRGHLRSRLRMATTTVPGQFVFSLIWSVRKRIAVRSRLRSLRSRRCRSYRPKPEYESDDAE